MELEDWDPMEEDYHSLAFNSYVGGRGLGIPIDRYPSYNRNKNSCQTVSLYVTGIPYDIDERGLKLIFSNYGRVHRSSRYFSKNTMNETCFGFVDFATLKEAEYAMRELNGKPPYNFRITFAKSKKEEKEQSDIREKELNDYLERSLRLNVRKCLPIADTEHSRLELNNNSKISRKGRSVGRGTVIINESGSLRSVPSMTITTCGNRREVSMFDECLDNSNFNCKKYNYTSEFNDRECRKLKDSTHNVAAGNNHFNFFKRSLGRGSGSCRLSMCDPDKSRFGNDRASSTYRQISGDNSHNYNFRLSQNTSSKQDIYSLNRHNCSSNKKVLGINRQSKVWETCRDRDTLKDGNFNSNQLCCSNCKSWFYSEKCHTACTESSCGKKFDTTNNKNIADSETKQKPLKKVLTNYKIEITNNNKSTEDKMCNEAKKKDTEKINRDQLNAIHLQENKFNDFHSSKNVLNSIHSNENKFEPIHLFENKNKLSSICLDKDKFEAIHIPKSEDNAVCSNIKFNVVHSSENEFDYNYSQKSALGSLYSYNNECENNNLFKSEFETSSLHKSEMNTHLQGNEFNNGNVKNQIVNGENFVNQLSHKNKLNEEKECSFEINQEESNSKNINIEKLVSSEHIEFSLSNGNKQIKYEEINADTELSLILSFGNSPEELWMHKLPDVYNNLMELSNSLQIYCDQSKSYLPQVREICGVFSVNNTWYRARIDKIEESGHCEVFLVDYGKYETISISNIRKLNAEFLKLPFQAILCELSSVKNAIDIFSDETVTFLQSKAFKVKLLGKFNNKYEIDLINEEGDSISNFLIKFNCDKATNNENCDKALDCNLQNNENVITERKNISFETKKFIIPSAIRFLKSGIKLKLQLVNYLSNKDFWVQPIIKEAEEILYELEELNEYTGKHDYSFQELERIVIAQCTENNLWYRAFITGKYDNHYSVRFIDYGNEKIITKFLPISSVDILLPSFAIHCMIDEPLSHEDGSLFEKHIMQNKSLCVTVTFCDKDKIRMKFEHSKNFSLSFMGYPWYHDIDINYLHSKIFSSENTVICKKEIDIYNNISSVINTLKVGSEILLLITTFEDDIFSAIIGEENLICSVINLEENLKIDCSNRVLSEYKFKLGDLVSAFSPSNNTWYRACIKKSIGESYIVYYIDYGKEEKVTTVYHLEEKYNFLPSPVVYFKVSGNTSDKLKNELIYSDNKVIKAIVRIGKDNKIYFQLLDTENGRVICQVIAFPWYYCLFEYE